MFHGLTPMVWEGEQALPHTAIGVSCKNSEMFMMQPEAENHSATKSEYVCVRLHSNKIKIALLCNNLTRYVILHRYFAENEFTIN